MPRKIYVINWDKREIKKGTGTISKGNVGFYQTRKQIPFLHPHSGAAYAKVASVGREGDVENRPTKHLGLKPLVDILAVPCGARGESEGWPESLLRRTNAISSVGCSPQVSPDTLAVSLVGIPETRAPTGVARKIATWIPPCGWWGKRNGRTFVATSTSRRCGQALKDHNGARGIAGSNQIAVRREGYACHPGAVAAQHLFSRWSKEVIGCACG